MFGPPHSTLILLDAPAAEHHMAVLATLMPSMLSPPPLASLTQAIINAKLGRGILPLVRHFPRPTDVGQDTSHSLEGVDIRGQ
jgi:hypothetical protein